MNIKVIKNFRECGSEDGPLPAVLLRVVLEFAGSLINKRHRMHRFLQIEFNLYNVMHTAGTITPSRLVDFYRYHGRDVLQDIMRQAVRNFDADNRLQITSILGPTRFQRISGHASF